MPDRPAGEVHGLRAARLEAYGAAKVTVGELHQGYVPVTFAQLHQGTADSDWTLVRDGWATVTAVHGIGRDHGGGSGHAAGGRLLKATRRAGTGKVRRCPPPGPGWRHWPEPVPPAPGGRR